MDHYGSVEDFFIYCQARGYDLGDLTPSPEDRVTTILLRGSEYIDGAYGARFPGVRTDGRAQEFQWPRTGAVDTEGNAIPENEIPSEVIKATYEAALREWESPGSLVPDQNPAEREKSVTVGPVSVTYADATAVQAGEPVYPVIGVIDRILEPLLGKKASPGLFGETIR